MKLLSLFENAEQFDEVQLDQHSYERSLERFLKQDVFPLMLKTKNSGPKDYVKVGNYFLITTNFFLKILLQKFLIFCCFFQLL